MLVADIKNPSLLKFSTIEGASLLEERANVKAAPVIVVRDSNRVQTLSAILTAFGLGLKNVMLVWGDRYPDTAHAKNAYDFPSLSSVVSEARAISRRTRAQARIFAPVDLQSLKTARGIRLADERLKAGADFLLAQPPTTDAGENLAQHSAIVESAGLKGRVLLGVFPFRDRKDIVECSKYFGWSLPRSLYSKAREGEAELLAEAREVARGVRRAGFPGVYLSTRGVPSVAKSVLTSV